MVFPMTNLKCFLHNPLTDDIIFQNMILNLQLFKNNSDMKQKVILTNRTTPQGIKELKIP